MNQKLTTKCREKIKKKYPNVNIVSNNVPRLPNTTWITITNTDAQAKLIGFDLHNICVSSGSACSSGKYLNRMY